MDDLFSLLNDENLKIVDEVVWGVEVILTLLMTR
jgi:hypothetical protein